MSDNYNQSNPYNGANTKQDYYNSGSYQNAYGEPSQLPMNYNYFPDDTDRFYEEESTGTGSFLMGALVGGVIGAAAALFLAPKTGKEMRNDFSEQAVQLKNKSIELSSTAKDKAVDFSSVAKDKAADFSNTAKDKATQISSAAKEKSGGLKKTVQDQTDTITQKVKSMSSQAQAPMDDGTASSEGEEPIIGEGVTTTNKKENGTSKGNNGNNNKTTNNSSSTSSKGNSNKGTNNTTKKSATNTAELKKETSYQTTKNSDVAYDNSDNVGKDKIMNQNLLSDEKPKNK